MPFNPHTLVHENLISGLSQFALARYTFGVTTNTTNRKLAFGFRNDSVAFINFYFERQTGFFLLQMYTPMILIVMCSWAVNASITYLEFRLDGYL